jgi:hypothetical protein
MPINRIFHQPQQMSDPIILRKHPRYIDAPTNGFHLLACPVEALAFHPEVGGHYQVSVRGMSENDGSVEVVCVEHPFIGDTWIIKMEDLALANHTNVQVKESLPPAPDFEVEERIENYRRFLFFAIAGVCLVVGGMRYQQSRNTHVQTQLAKPDSFEALKKQGIDVRISDAIRKKLSDRNVRFDVAGNMTLADSGVVQLYKGDRPDTKVYRVDAYDQPQGIITVMILSVAPDGTNGDTQVIHIGPDGLKRI